MTVAIRTQLRVRQRWLVSLNLDNVLDEYYREHGSGFAAPGRNLALRMEWDW